MPRTPRLTKSDLADLEARHKVVTARVIAAEDLARHHISQPIADASRHLISAIAGQGEVSAVKRSVFGGVRALSEALQGAASQAVQTAREHARNLATGQAVTDLAHFAKQATEHGFRVAGHPFVKALPGMPGHNPTKEHDAAVSNQAGMSLAHRWSSEMLGNYVQWKRGAGGVDKLITRMRQVGQRPGGGLGALVETQAITQSVDAYADEHALTWRRIAEQVAGTDFGPDDASIEPAARWGEGLYEMNSAILDRKTCAYCFGKDGELERAGVEREGGRAPYHLRCRCSPTMVWIPEAAVKAMPGVQLDYEQLKSDVKAYAKGSTFSLGEGKRHAQEFVRDALAGSSSAALAEHLAGRRSWFPQMGGARAPRLLV